MKLGSEPLELDAIDLQILELLQDQGRVPLVKLGEQVGLWRSAVGYRPRQKSSRIAESSPATTPRSMRENLARMSPRSSESRSRIRKRPRHCENTVAMLDDVARVSSHYRRAYGDAEDQDRQRFVAGAAHRHDSLDRGMSRTETMVVLSTHTERATISVAAPDRPSWGATVTAASIATAPLRRSSQTPRGCEYA